MNHWNLDTLKHQLQSRKPLVKDWIITQEYTHRRERYFMADHLVLAIDQDREVHAQTVSVKLMVQSPSGKSDRQGEITQKLFTSLPLAGQLDAAIRSAQQADHQAWSLPTEMPSAEALPQPKTTDPGMAEDLESVVQELSGQIAQAVAKKRSTAFNSAELFLSTHDRELHLSNGLVYRSSQSRIYAEAAYSFARKSARGEMESDEYLSSQWAVHRDDLDIPRLFDETSDRAEHSLSTIKPKTGKYPVIVDADVLATLFNSCLAQLSGGNAYNGLPFIHVGEDFIPEASGDRLSISLDPHMDFGADTAILSDQGVTQRPLDLVDRNRVIATSTDKQYGDYLGSAPTTVRGNLVVSPGALSHEQLTRQAPQVLEILQFSGLFVDPNSGTFGSEIRLARLYDNENGEVTYIKGGSLSASVRENFRGIRLSKNRVRRATFASDSTHGEGYFGPEHALLGDVSIVG